MPRVLNKRTAKASELRDAVYVGRPSVYGNPYSHRASKIPGTILVKTREEAIARYRGMVESRPALVEAIKNELRGKNLVCWCAPEACHADFLLEIANAD